MRKKWIWLSLGMNVLLMGTAIFFVGKRWHFQRELHAGLRKHSYRDNPQYWEQWNIQGAYERQADIVMLGDSHVYKAQWEDLLNRPDVTARGIGSDVTDGYLARFDQVIKAHPKIVFIEGGANDLYYDRPVDSILANITTLLDELYCLHIRVVLHTLPPYADFAAGADSFNRKVVAFNTALIDLCRKTGTPYIDLYRLFQVRGYLRAEYAQQDGYHLTGDAYKLWAGEIQKKLAMIK